MQRFVFILLLLSAQALALEPIVVEGASAPVDLTPYIHQLSTNTETQGINDAAITLFSLNDSREIHKLRFAVENRTQDTLEFVFSSGLPIYQMHLQRIVPPDIERITGFNIPRDERLVTQLPAIEVTLPPGRSEFLLRLDTDGAPFIADFHLQPKAMFWSGQQLSLWIFLFLAGGMLGLALYSLLYFFSLRKNAFLYLSCLVLAYIALEAVIAGLPLLYLDPPYAAWVGSHWIVLNALCMIGLILFSNSYFSTSVRYPRYTRLTQGFIGFSFMVPMLYSFAPTMIGSLYVVSNISIYFSIIALAMRQMIVRPRPSTVYFLGIVPAMIVLVIFFARIFQLIDTGPLLNNLRLVVVTLTAVVFFVGNLVLIDQTRASHQLLVGTLGEAASQEKLSYLIENKLQFDGTPRTRLITIVFVDIVGFSKAISTLAQDQSFELIRDFISEISLIIQHHGGIVDRSMGDGMISFFGYDLVEERPDHGSDALQAAIAIQKHSLARFLSDEVDPKTPRFPLRIGINTDRICIGNLGDGERFDVSLVGEGVFLARRFEAACEPHKILLGQNTFDMLAVRWRNQLKLTQRFVPLPGKQGLVHAFECDPFRDRPKLLQEARDRFWRAEISALRQERFDLGYHALVFSTNQGPMELVNFSRGGFCLKTAANLSRGTHIEVDLAPLTNIDLIRFMSPITVEVTWATSGDGISTMLGVRFCELNEKQRHLLCDTLRSRYGGSVELVRETALSEIETKDSGDHVA